MTCNEVAGWAGLAQSAPGPRVHFTLPGHPLMQCEAQAVRLNGWSIEVTAQQSLLIFPSGGMANCLGLTSA